MRGGICLPIFTEGGSWVIFLLVPYGTSLQVAVPFKSSASSPEQQLYHASTKPVFSNGDHLIERQKGKVRGTLCILSTL